jgi:hypothetical protein
MHYDLAKFAIAELRHEPLGQKKHRAKEANDEWRLDRRGSAHDRPAVRSEWEIKSERLCRAAHIAEMLPGDDQ